MFLPLTSRERFRRRPWATGATIAACVYFFAAEQCQLFALSGAGRRFQDDPPHVRQEYLAQEAARIVERMAFKTPADVASLFSYAFAHASFWHLAGNMWFLWTFGRLVEGRWGRLACLTCFGLASASGAMVHFFVRGGDGPLVGASGAITGLAGAALVALPNARFDRLLSPLFWPVTPIVELVRRQPGTAICKLLPIYGWILRLENGVPALFVLPAWLLNDVVGMFASHSRVSYACHVGGAFAGIGVGLLLRLTRAPDLLEKAIRRLRNRPEEDDEPPAGLSPAVRELRIANRPSRMPRGPLSIVWFVASIMASLGAMGFSAGVDRFAKTRAENAAVSEYREKLLLSRDPRNAEFDASVVHPTTKFDYPSLYRCTLMTRRNQYGDTPHPVGCDISGGSAEELLLKLEHEKVAAEYVEVFAWRNGAARRDTVIADVRAALVKSSSGHEEKNAAKGKPKLKTKTKTKTEAEAEADADADPDADGARETFAPRIRDGAGCRGDGSIEIVADVGHPDAGVHTQYCAFIADGDLYMVGYAVPQLLRERDEATLRRIADGVTPVTKPAQKRDRRVR